MSYFSRFPLLAHTFDSGVTVNVVSDILRRIKVNEETKENFSLLEEYVVKDGETPETVSFKFYNDTQYHWIVMLLNDIIDPRFDWPLTDTQLYDYVNSKYNGNISGVKQYKISQDSDIIVSNDQVTTFKEISVEKYKFAKDVSLHFGYAANGSPTSDLSANDAALVNFLRSPTTTPYYDPQGGPFIVLRGDVGRARTHPFYSGIYLNNPPENVEGNFAYDYYRYYFDGADVGNADVNAVSIMATYSGYEYRPGHFAALDYPPVARTVGSFLAPYLIGEFRENTSYHIIHELIKPIVDSGNTTLLPYLDIRTDRGPNPYSAHYYKNGNYYFVSNLFVQVMDNVVAGVGAVSSGHPELYNYFLQPIDQQYYLKGDFNQSGMIGGNVSGGYHYWSPAAGFASNSWPETSNVYGGYGNTDVEIALMSYNDELSETTGYPGYRSGAFYSNVQIALNEMYNDSVLNEYVQIVSASSTSNTTLTYPNAVAITNLEYESSLNEEKRTIKVLRPKYLSSFLAEFEALVNG